MSRHACAVFLAWWACGVIPGVRAADLPAQESRSPDPRTGSRALLPLPGSLPLAEYEAKLHKVLDDRAYRWAADGTPWTRDKRVRDTGPYIDRVSYGTHPAVRVFYSPEVIAWLKGGRKGSIPDGAMIVKEQFEAPAARWEGMSDETLNRCVSSWTVMVKEASASTDGWFWAEYAPHTSNTPEVLAQRAHAFPYAYPRSGFGHYCVRCHATAENEFTFASLKNIEGFDGEPLSFRVDDSWMPVPSDGTDMPARNSLSVARTLQAEGEQHGLAHRTRSIERRVPRAPIHSDSEFLSVFHHLTRQLHHAVPGLPNETFDVAVSRPAAPQHFVTSSQCMSCHSASVGPYPTMFIPDKQQPFNEDRGPRGFDYSPFGEWRWSMMGLAGRDPVFHAQLESELARQPKHAATIIDTCFRCHGVMGQRQFHLDHGDAAGFPLDFLRITDPRDPNFKYGALARDGVSCTVCHRMVDDGRPLRATITGKFSVGRVDEIFGPYRDREIVPLAMKNALGVTPQYSPLVRSSRLCASCHVLEVPVFNKAGDQVGTEFEQATYLEWVNSAYNNEIRPDDWDARSCQQCHMPGRHKGQSLRARIATIEDDTYPTAEHKVGQDAVRVRVRDNPSRHELLGINVTTLEMFRQFDTILGVRRTDFMTGSSNGLENAIANAVRQARTATATVEIDRVEIASGSLTARVKVTNLAGHRFPTGVGIRRAFLEFSVVDVCEQRERLVWASGRTSGLGILVDQNGKPLPSEFFERGHNGAQQYEPHYQRIKRQDQVQIYQTLSKNPEHEITSTFLALHEKVKDNRILPRGWTRDGPPGASLSTDLIRATHPFGTGDDPDYQDGGGSDIVTYEVPLADLGDPKDLKVSAKLYYQSTPPFYFRMRFEDAQGEATRRLHYLASHLNLRDDRAEALGVASWKLFINSDEKNLADVERGQER